MKPWLHQIEKIVDRAIPYLLLLLIYVIISDLFFKEFAQIYHLQLTLIDSFVIIVFVIDLFFKYNRVRKVPKFLKRYWLDIIAVFPFFLFFRLLEEGYLLSEIAVTRLQKLLHTGVIIEEESALIVSEAGKVVEEAAKVEKVAKAGRTRLLTKFIRPIQRVPRLMKAFAYYEKPSVKRKN